jgi:hypothetical protein
VRVPIVARLYLLLLSLPRASSTLLGAQAGTATLGRHQRLRLPWPLFGIQGARALLSGAGLTPERAGELLERPAAGCRMGRCEVGSLLRAEPPLTLLSLP